MTYQGRAEQVDAFFARMAEDDLDAAPDLTDEYFATAFFALLEYKSILERQLLDMTKKGALPGHKGKRNLRVDNAERHLETQEHIYGTLYRLVTVVNSWFPRARELSLL